jgi:hypothetical protein
MLSVSVKGSYNQEHRRKADQCKRVHQVALILIPMLYGRTSARCHLP